MFVLHSHLAQIENKRNQGKPKPNSSDSLWSVKTGIINQQAVTLQVPCIHNIFKELVWYSNIIPIGSMGLAYLPTFGWILWSMQVNIPIYLEPFGYWFIPSNKCYGQHIAIHPHQRLSSSLQISSGLGLWHKTIWLEKSSYMCHGQKSLYWGWSSHL